MKKTKLVLTKVRLKNLAVRTAVKTGLVEGKSCGGLSCGPRTDPVVSFIVC